MGTTQVSFEVSDSVLLALNENQVEFARHLRLLAALQFFKDHKLSLGKAAELAGVTKERFVIELDDHDIDLVSYEASELTGELERFRQ